MSVVTVNNHVLLPHRASYTRPVSWQRAWTNKVASSVLGTEKRVALRTGPRQQVSWSFEPVSLEEANALLERLKAARKSGYAAAPRFGYGMALAEAVDGVTATVTALPARVYADDYLIFIAGTGDTWDVVQVDRVNGKTLTLSDALENAYAAGEMFWVLMFGKFECDELPLIVDEDFSVPCSLRELKTRAVTASDLCCSDMEREGASDTFECYPPENPLVSVLGSGGGWAEPWVFLKLLGVCVWEPWTFYPNTETPSGLNGGVGLLDVWVFNVYRPYGTYCRETFGDGNTFGWHGTWNYTALVGGEGEGETLITDDLLAVWKLESNWGGSSDSYDAGPYNLTDDGGTGAVAAKEGNGATFTGYGQHLYTTNAAFKRGNNDYSISLWAKCTSTSIRQVQVLLGNGAYGRGAPGFYLYADFSSGKAGIAVSGTSADAQYWEFCESAANAISVDVAFHMVAVFDATNGELRLYVDGVESTTTKARTWGEALSSYDGRLCFGRWPQYEVLGLTGWLDEVYWWNRALTADEAISLDTAFYPFS